MRRKAREPRNERTFAMKRSPDGEVDHEQSRSPTGSDEDRLREYCGVFGIFDHPDAAVCTALGLHALQHRGQEAAGIVSFDGSRFHAERRLGLVGDHFSKESTIKRLPGASAVGHVRYATTGETILRNVQPLFAELNSGGFAVGHNGNLTNAQTLRRELIGEGAIFQSTSDTEVILHLVARSRKTKLIERFIEALRQIEGAYALVVLTNLKLIGARDPLGIRPLVIGELEGRYILASETCALDILGARFVRDVENGEIVVISEEGIESIKPFPKQAMRPCIFEYIYFARPDSIVHGRPVYDVRKAMGATKQMILTQFTTEAVTLCAVGGVIGVAVGAIITWIVYFLPIGIPASLSALWVFIGFTVSCTIGLVFGIYPAWKASKLDPIEALRYE